MGLENLRCFNCQKYGHLAKDCPEVVFAAELGTDGRPPWCGQCDKRTRLLYGAESARRCPECHPEKDLPPQFRICKCGNAVYRWDRSECGTHQEVGKHIKPRKKEEAE